MTGTGNDFFISHAAKILSTTTEDANVCESGPCTRNLLNLLSGQYSLSVYLLDDSGLQVYDMAETVCPFHVHSSCREFGIAYIPYHWQL